MSFVVNERASGFVFKRFLNLCFNVTFSIMQQSHSLTLGVLEGAKSLIETKRSTCSCSLRSRNTAICAAPIVRHPTFSIEFIQQPQVEYIQQIPVTYAVPQMTYAAHLVMEHIQPQPQVALLHHRLKTSCSHRCAPSRYQSPIVTEHIQPRLRSWTSQSHR